MKSKPFVSVIITTYNWPCALMQVLSSLAIQTYPHFEILIADDGSGRETSDSISQIQNNFPIPITHVWQSDEGFQAAKIRNKAVATAKGDYLIFLDGDCIPFKDFVATHVKLAEQGWLIAGNRVLLRQTFTEKVLKNKIQLFRWGIGKWLILKCLGSCNRILPLISLPLPRKLQAKKWQGVKTCNLGLWKKDFMSVNGFDESFQGWGYEDSDLVIRLMKTGVRRKSGKFALPVIHLWHKEQERDQEKVNFNLLCARLTNELTISPKGVKQYL